MDKKQYEKLKDIKRKMQAGEKTTFAERNIINIYNKRTKKKKSITP